MQWQKWERCTQRFPWLKRIFPSPWLWSLNILVLVEEGTPQKTTVKPWQQGWETRTRRWVRKYSKCTSSELAKNPSNGGGGRACQLQWLLKLISLAGRIRWKGEIDLKAQWFLEIKDHTKEKSTGKKWALEGNVGYFSLPSRNLSVGVSVFLFPLQVSGRQCMYPWFIYSLQMGWCGTAILPHCVFFSDHRGELTAHDS